MREEQNDDCPPDAVQSLKRDLLRITADSYTKYQAYPSDIFEIEGFREFVEEGYYKKLQEEKKNPYKVLKEKPHMRD